MKEEQEHGKSRLVTIPRGGKRAGQTQRDAGADQAVLEFAARSLDAPRIPVEAASLTDANSL